MTKNRFFITAAIPYVNAKPHIGHALEFVQGDVIARWHRAQGEDTWYVTGADENSLKIVQAAEKEQVETKALTDRYAASFQDFLKLFNISIDIFQRSSSPEHFVSAQELWQRCVASGDVYKKRYEGLYCVGCEAFYTTDELNDKGECFNHPGKPVDRVEEENYFFKLSRYKEQLKHIIENDEYRILPETRKREALGLFNDKFEDFSISRSVARAKGWGVLVPGDDSQIMYVWFDALNVYRSASGERWPADIHLIGKDIIRFHAIYWPAILLSAKLPLPKQLWVHGFVTVDGQKMSKTIGNVVDPVELVQTHGVEPVRYYLLREIPSGDDGDFSFEKLANRYNGDLANGLGNFASRVLAMGAKVSFDGTETVGVQIQDKINEIRASIREQIEEFRLNEALASIWQLVSFGDGYINETEAWKNSDRQVLYNLISILEAVVELLSPFLPATADTIATHITRTDGVIAVTKTEPLFPRRA